MTRVKILLLLPFALMLVSISNNVFAYTGKIIITDQMQDLMPRLQTECILCSTVFGKNLGSLNSLKRKAKEDVKSMTNKLTSLGYFDAVIDIEIKKTTPFEVKFIVDPGQAFQTAKIQIKCNQDSEHALLLETLVQEVQLQKEYLIFQDYEKMRIHMEYSLKKRGFAHAKVDLPTLDVNYDLKEVIAIYSVHLGKIYQFGDFEIEGCPAELNPALLEKRFFWKKGDIFDISLIDKSKEEILDLQIFSVVSIEAVDDGDHLQKMKIKLKEGKQKTISGVLRSFSNDILGATVSWRHKNLFDNAEQFDISAKFSVIEKGITANLLKPDFLGVLDQKLFLQIGKLNAAQIAYTTDILKTSGGLKHKLSRTLGSSSLLTVEWNMQNTKTSSPQLQYNDSWKNLAYLPLNIKWDTRDSTSDPTQGWLSSLDIIPYFPTIFSTIPIQLQAQQTAYVSLGAITYGANLKFGTFLNTVFSELPEHKQFFGGGDGSIRGYAPQTLSVGLWKSQGAHSKFEFTQEMRVKLNEDWGIVGFMDLGIYSKNQNPFLEATLMKEIEFEKQKSPISMSFGVGFNYLSLIGPVRLDIAFPFVTRKTPPTQDPIDSSFQFYVRFGQGF